MRTFVAVAEEQGFSAAARRLGSSPPAVTRAIAALEEELGVKLLHRTTRSVRVTEPGHRYLEDARQILLAVESADEAAAGINSEPRGHLAITAPTLFGRKFVMPTVIEYLNTFPDTEVDTLFVDRVVNLVEEGLDLGVRIGQLPDSTLRAIPVGFVHWTVAASPEYLKHHVAPRNPTDLKNHSLISSRAGDFSSTWRFGSEAEQLIQITPRLRTTTNDSAIEAARSGLGITRLLSYQVAEFIESGELIRLLPEFEPSPLPVHVIHREGRHASSKIRTFIDLLSKNLKGTNLR